ncbi:MAG: hypothetical protein H0W86_13540 [Armatimonadetes bacterium]|nr:hypothetical protein [Armatimonadota bacterium]
MNGNSTTGLRCLAFVGGLVFLGGTIIQVFGDVIKGAAITEKHLLSAVVIIGAILVGHIAVEAFRVGKYGSMLGFSLIFAACTALVVLMSVGRQGETMAWTQAQVDDAADARAATRASLKEADAMLKSARKALADECKSGKGRNCTGIEATITVYEGSVAGYEAKLEKLGPPKLVAPEEEQFAKLVATFFSVDKDRVKAGTIMAKPFFVSAVCEFGVILCFGFAFRGDKKTIVVIAEKQTIVAKAEPTELSDVSDAELSELGRFFGPDKPNGSNPNKPNRPNKPDGTRRFAKEQVLQSLLTQLALGERFGSQDDMRERFGLPKSTLSNWLNEWQEAGLIPARRQVGRCKALANA